MKILYECEKVAILEDNEKMIIHILDDYRLVKEVITNRSNLVLTLKKEFNKDDKHRKSIFKKKKKLYNQQNVEVNINDIMDMFGYRKIEFGRI